MAKYAKIFNVSIFYVLLIQELELKNVWIILFLKFYDIGIKNVQVWWKKWFLNYKLISFYSVDHNVALILLWFVILAL